MDIEYFPDKVTVEEAMQVDDPLLMLVAYDESRILLANIDDVFEHIILLRKLNYPESDIDKYFRLVINHHGADWTFVCPSGYKDIKNKDASIRQFYNDGIGTIIKALKLIDYPVEINIPQRYRRHFNLIVENEK